MNNSNGQPPLRARLHWYRLTSDELVLLQAMVEHCSDGSVIWAAIPRLAAYSKLSERTIQRLIHGEDRPGRPHRAGLVERGILTQLAPENRGQRRPATYRLNEEALELDPLVRLYRNLQAGLPGIRRPPIPGEPVTGVRGSPVQRDRQVSPGHRTGVPGSPVQVSQGQESGVPGSPVQVSQGQESGVPGSPDSKAFDPKHSDSQTKIHHGDAALKALPVLEAMKEQLRSELTPEEWDSWVRPMYLLKTMPGGKHILATLPPNGKVMHQAQQRVPLMRELLAPAGYSVSLTPYPDAWQVEEARERYGVDMAPKPWTRRGGDA